MPLIWISDLHKLFILYKIKHFYVPYCAVQVCLLLLEEWEKKEMISPNIQTSLICFLFAKSNQQTFVFILLRESRLRTSSNCLIILMIICLLKI